MKNSNNLIELFFWNFFPRLNCLQRMWTTYLTHTYFPIPLFLSFMAIDKSCHRRSKKLLADNLPTHPQKVSFIIQENIQKKLVEIGLQSWSVKLGDFARLVVLNLKCFPLHYCQKMWVHLVEILFVPPPLLILT